MQSKVWDALFSVSAQNRVSTHSSLAMGWYVPANFFWDKCEGFLYDCQVSKNNLKISDNFPNTSGRCSKFFRRCSNFLSTFPIWSSCLVPTIKMQSESNSFSVLWYTWDTQSTLHAFLEYFKDMELNFFIDHVFKNKIVRMCESEIHVKNIYCPWWVRMMSVVPRHNAWELAGLGLVVKGSWSLNMLILVIFFQNVISFQIWLWWTS